ncbi:MAG: hypothetical protein U1E23_14650 [Reyranellaceae bacterium]
MRSDLLHVVCAVANPMRWDSRLRLYRAFEAHMLDSGVRLTTVECAYGDRDFEVADSRHVNVVRVRANGAQMIWNKENLLNLGIARLPEAKYIATVDADVFFRKRYWAAETVHELQHHCVVQPWSDCYDLGPHDEHLAVHRSFCRLVFDGEPMQMVHKAPYRFGHPGYAWAWRRGTLDALGGLIEMAALGAGDHHMALAMIGKADRSLPGGIHPNYRQAVMAWQERATAHVAGNIGHVDGTIEHRWHGTKERRRYVGRWEILTRHRYDPVVDLKRNVFGVVELAGNKPGLRLDVHRYFHARDEDSNSLG